MLKDRRQKATALRLAVARRWFPQLEVRVTPEWTTGSRRYDITDVDVLASIPDEFRGYRAVAFDCKSSRREPPMSRTLWLRGLMNHIAADHGFCVLGKSGIERDHKLAASQLGISLLDEQEFEVYAATTGDSRNSNKGSHLAQIDKWEAFLEIGRQYKTLDRLIQFSRATFWIATTDAEACRRIIAGLMETRGELDPAKSEHLVVVGDQAALFLHSLSRLIIRIFSAFVHPQSREVLSESLLYLLYGGRDSYELANRLFQQTTSGDVALSLPEWPSFIQLARALLESPLQALQAPLLVREIAWSTLENDADRSFADKLIVDSSHAAKFAALGIEYLVKAARLPPDFARYYSRIFLSAPMDPSSALRQNRLPLS